MSGVADPILAPIQTVPTEAAERQRQMAEEGGATIRAQRDELREKTRQLTAENDTLWGRVQELEAQLHDRDPGDEDDSAKPWWKRLFE